MNQEIKAADQMQQAIDEILAQDFCKGHDFGGFTGLVYPSIEPSDLSEMERYSVLVNHKEKVTYKGQMLDGKLHGVGQIFYNDHTTRHFQEGIFEHGLEAGRIRSLRTTGVVNI